MDRLGQARNVPNTGTWSLLKKERNCFEMLNFKKYISSTQLELEYKTCRRVRTHTRYSSSYTLL